MEPAVRAYDGVAYQSFMKELSSIEPKTVFGGSLIQLGICLVVIENLACSSLKK